VKAVPRSLQTRERPVSWSSPPPLHDLNGWPESFDAPSWWKAGVTCCVQIWGAQEEEGSRLSGGRFWGVSAI